MDLIPRVLAQTVDEVASPTIPFVPPGGTSGTPVPSVITGPNISLSTTQFSIGVGEKIKIVVSLDTKAVEIKEYAFQITFDPTKLQIVDEDTTQAGTQIKYTDTNFFATVENSAAQTTGIITLHAKSSQGSITYSGRAVAEFELVGLSESLSQVSISKPNSFMLNNNSTDILESVNTLSVTVAKETSQFTPTPSGPSHLPDNALIDDIGMPRAIILGMLMIVSGLYIMRQRRSGKSKRVQR
jgi:hypothetical protein